VDNLNRAYWWKHRGVLLTAGVCSFGVLVHFMRGMHDRGGMLAMFVIQALLCSPFRLKTVAGRLWWASYGIGLACGSGAVVLGIHSPLGWLCAFITACCFAIGTCLRWNTVEASQISIIPTRR